MVRERVVKDLQQQVVTHGAMMSDQRVEYMRQRNRLDEYRQGLQREEEIERDRRARHTKMYLQDQEERFAKVMERKKMDRFLEEKMVQKIRDESEELRELELKLREVHVKMARDHQVQEKQLLMEQEKVRFICETVLIPCIVTDAFFSCTVEDTT